MFNEYIFFEQDLYQLKCINLCRESGSSSSNDNCHLSLEAFSLVSNENIRDSNPLRLERQYGCIDLVENHPSIGQLNRLFVLERLYISAPVIRKEVISLLSLSLEVLNGVSCLFLVQDIQKIVGGYRPMVISSVSLSLELLFPACNPFVSRIVKWSFMSFFGTVSIYYGRI